MFGPLLRLEHHGRRALAPGPARNSLVNSSPLVPPLQLSFYNSSLTSPNLANRHSDEPLPCSAFIYARSSACDSSRAVLLFAAWCHEGAHTPHSAAAGRAAVVDNADSRGSAAASSTGRQPQCRSVPLSACMSRQLGKFSSSRAVVELLLASSFIRFTEQKLGNVSSTDPYGPF